MDISGDDTASLRPRFWNESRSEPWKEVPHEAAAFTADVASAAGPRST